MGRGNIFESYIYLATVSKSGMKRTG